MKKPLIHISIIYFLLIFSVPDLAAAQVGQTIEQQKKSTIYGLYQITYGAQERCKPFPKEALDIKTAIDQLWIKFPELLPLIDSSPYLSVSREFYKTRLADPNISSESDEQIRGECAYFKSLLVSMVNDAGGQQATKDMIETLKK
jgi:hypothetical protein